MPVPVGPVGCLQLMKIKCSCLGEGPDKLHSGVTFDPLGLAYDHDTFTKLQVLEIQIGQLAILMFTCYMQTILTDEGLIFSYT